MTVKKKLYIILIKHLKNEISNINQNPFRQYARICESDEVTWPTGRKYESYPLTMSIHHIEKLSKLINVDKCELIELAVAENENAHEPSIYCNE